MLLKDTFFTLKRTEHSAGENYTDRTTARVELNPQHPIFQGHFPGKPIVPGVCEIEMVKEILTTVTDSRYQLSKIKLCRFKAVLTPATCTEVDILIEWNQGDTAESTMFDARVVGTDGTVYLEMTAEKTNAND